MEMELSTLTRTIRGEIKPDLTSSKLYNQFPQTLTILWMHCYAVLLGHYKVSLSSSKEISLF